MTRRLESLVALAIAMGAAFLVGYIVHILAPIPRVIDALHEVTR